MADKEKVEKVEIDEETYNRILDDVPLRVIDNIPELEYYSNPNPSAADTLAFLSCIMKNGRILEFSKKTLKIAEGLFRQGLIFRHSKGAIKHKATRYSRTEEENMKKMAEECDCADCRGGK